MFTLTNVHAFTRTHIHAIVTIKYKDILFRNVEFDYRYVNKNFVVPSNEFYHACSNNSVTFCVHIIYRNGGRWSTRLIRDVARVLQVQRLYWLVRVVWHARMAQLRHQVVYCLCVLYLPYRSSVDGGPRAAATLTGTGIWLVITRRPPLQSLLIQQLWHH